MNHPATRDPLGSRSPGCCYHTWNPQLYAPCRICQRPVLSLQPCSGLRRPALMPHPLVRGEPEHRPEHQHHPEHHYHHHHPEYHQEQHHDRAYERPRRQRSFEGPSPRRRDGVDIADGRPASNPHYHTHPPPSGSSSAGYHLTKSASVVRLGSPGGSLGQRSPGARAPQPPCFDQSTHRWIGEETKRSLPSHVYKYYLAHTKEYRRQNIKVIIARPQRARSTIGADVGGRLINLDVTRGRLHAHTYTSSLAETPA